MITDSHAHIYYDSFDSDRDAIVARAHASGVTRMIVVGTSVASSRQCFDIAQRVPGTFPTAGMHPHDASDSTPAARAEIERMCRSAECVAVGETGLDYFKNYSPKEAQLDNFRWHARLALALDKPLIVHCRDAHDDTLAVLREHGGLRGVMHCYTYGAAELPPYLELGFHISFSGVVTYPKNEHNRAAARAVPEERLLVETDCPFLAPHSRRGQRNEPALCRDVLQRIADERGTSLEALARATSANATRLFGLPE
ncbi:MAG: TatD family hydrolase [Planctomycetes bacterium]|nr:TatD family hydrolase [Planctomycetota bacterium]